jgi:hypothetical protein
MVGKVGTRMTNGEKWKAAIEEMKPLLEALKGIRDKYRLSCVEIRARNFFDENGCMSVLTADDDRNGVEVGEAYGLSWRDYEEDSMNNDFTIWIRQPDKEEEVE